MNRKNKAFVYALIVVGVLISQILPVSAQGNAFFPNVKRKAAESIISKYYAAQVNLGLSDEEKIKEVIDAYFVIKYESQKLLEKQDFSLLLDDATLEWVRKEKDKRDVELYIAELFNLNYIDYRYTLEYDAIEIKKNKATAWLRESHEVVFASAAPEVSKMANLPHIITLTHKNGFWVISKDEYQDETSLAFNYQTKQELMEQVSKNYELNKKISLGAKFQADLIASPLSLVNYSYNRTRAVNYADTYWSNYNTAWYVTEPNNDCTNYVSQALYAGEGKNPPDTSGMTTAPNRDYTTDWYYVWNNSGSLPWIRVGRQFTFITGNTNKIGPNGTSTASFCNTNVGDVVQLYNPVDGWFHEGIITMIVNPCGGLQFYYVNAHTINRYHYPLAYWAQYTMRFIKINGWRGN